MKSLFRFERPRQNQEAIMKSIEEALTSGKDILVNAPTGTGKTDASIGAALGFAMENGLDVFFLTPKISQHKIAVDSLREIREKFDRKIKYVDIVGKRNLCINTDINALESEAFYKGCEKAVGSRKCSFYTNAKEHSNITEEIIEASYRGHNALFEQSFKKGVCAYEVATYLAKDANFIIADYAHMLNPYTRASFLKKISHRLENAIVIWDEAHNILGSAASYMSTSLSTNAIAASAKELLAIGSSIDLEYLQFMLSKIADRRLDGKNEAFVHDGDIPEEITKNADSVAGQLEKAGMEYLTESKAKRSSLMHMANFLRALDEKDESVASIISKGSRGFRFSLTCLYPEKAIGLFEEIYANIFMSGTLLPLQMYKELFGIDNALAQDFGSPFPKGNKLCIVDGSVSTKYENRSNDEYKKIAARIEEVRSVANGNIAVFFPSFAVLNAVYRNMKKEVEYIQRSEMRSVAVEKFIEEFKKSRNATMFGVMGGSMSEGIDYANNAIKGIIIVGIPLEKPSLEIRAKIEYMNKRFCNKGTEYAYLIPGIIRAAQAAGRAVRSETDRAFVIFMDKRYGWRSYKSLIENFVEITECSEIMEPVKKFLQVSETEKQKYTAI